MPTAIQWTDETWNPIRARRRLDGKQGWWCAKVSPACRNCYAEKMNIGRFGNGIRYARDEQPEVECYLDERTLKRPLDWRRSRKVFPCSMTDLYGDWVPDEWLDRMYAVMALTPHHSYIVLTKRPERRAQYLHTILYRDGVQARIGKFMAELSDRPLREPAFPLVNVIEMGSLGTQAEVESLGPALISTPTAFLGLSIEPMLEPIVLSDGLLRAARWVICGGESGQSARPCDVRWIRQLRDQCAKSNIPFFLKQLGAHVLETGHRIRLRDPKGGDQSEWPKDLLIREYFNS